MALRYLASETEQGCRGSVNETFLIAISSFGLISCPILAGNLF
jgi:hypothetical protein